MPLLGNRMLPMPAAWPGWVHDRIITCRLCHPNIMPFYLFLCFCLHHHSVQLSFHYARPTIFVRLSRRCLPSLDLCILHKHDKREKLSEKMGNLERRLKTETFRQRG